MEKSNFEVFTGEDTESSILNDIMYIDTSVYEEEYVGCIENIQSRFDAENRSLVCIKEKTTGKLAGYINFFPVTDALWEEIIETGTQIRDDDIRADEIKPFVKGEESNLFIISIVILPEYRKSKDAVITLTEGFREYLLKLIEDGFKIKAIAGTAISEDGRKFARERFFRVKREVKGLDGNIDQVLLCDGESLQLFLSGLLNKVF